MNTVEKIIVRENKVLKLNNVLIREISRNELIDIDKIYYMMNSYIKSKGTTTLGPIINYSSVEIDESGQANIIIKLIVQLKTFINKVDLPYEIKPQIRIANCLFARFNEKEENIEFAYKKLELYAFENDIKLKGDSYTVFIKQGEDEFVADVFMESLKGGNLLESL